MNNKKLVVTSDGHLVSTPRNFVRISELAEEISGTLYIGKPNDRVQGLTTIWSAKDQEVCLISSEEDLRYFTCDVRTVVTTRTLAPRFHGINVITISEDSIERATRKMMNMFSDLTKASLRRRQSA